MTSFCDEMYWDLFGANVVGHANYRRILMTAKVKVLVLEVNLKQ